MLYNIGACQYPVPVCKYSIWFSWREPCQPSQSAVTVFRQGPLYMYCKYTYIPHNDHVFLCFCSLPLYIFQILLSFSDSGFLYLDLSSVWQGDLPGVTRLDGRLRVKNSIRQGFFLRRKHRNPLVVPSTFKVEGYIRCIDRKAVEQWLNAILPSFWNFLWEVPLKVSEVSLGWKIHFLCRICGWRCQGVVVFFFHRFFFHLDSANFKWNKTAPKDAATDFEFVGMATDNESVVLSSV